MPELVPGGYYQFKVSALNSIGESQMSSALVMIAATVPDAPTMPQLIESDRTSITLTWSVTYDGGAVVDDFEIDWKPTTASEWTDSLSSTGGATTFTVNSLVMGDFYDFRVRARNEVGLSLDSMQATYLAAQVPQAPSTPSKVSADKSQITIGWTPSPDDGGSPLTQFRILWNAGGEEEVFLETATVSADTLQYTRSGLNAYAGLPFKFKVVADNDQGSSAASDSVRILAATVPSAPSAPVKVEADKTTIKVRW